MTSTYPSISTNSGSSFPFSFLWFGSEKAELAADTQLKPGVDARDLEKKLDIKLGLCSVKFQVGEYRSPIRAKLRVEPKVTFDNY